MRTEEEQERLGRLIDGLPARDLWAVVEEVVGPRRSVELTAWALLWCLRGETDPTALRHKMEAQGLTERAAYRALADYRRIGDRLLELPSPPSELASGDSGPAVASLLHRYALVVA